MQSKDTITFHALNEISLKDVKAIERLKPRSEILNLAATTGQLAAHFKDGDTVTDSEDKERLEETMGQLLIGLVRAARVCSLDLCRCIKAKIALNAKKYPVELCKGKAGKYTTYSNETGITKTAGQSTVKDVFDATNDTTDDTVENISAMVSHFVNERNWSQYHTPRNLCLALIGELGELCELFQWAGDNGEGGSSFGLQGWTKDEVDKVGQELADVSIYLLRLASESDVDIGKAAMKIAENSC
eukprot:CAMPEP_0116006032 /NCGR_PEP_ID=MMETSP0321-20121206/1497_1 /TAXON_ID=163516 /ORGANISM="Leptocylindrus danicus var. danicus, Strain B650" /LENGTH=243 /DNA_ID=CAMNT_0003474529 /DNA_START=96 /DNA_END=827 /DNA_ORIENTATION=-